MKNFQILGIEPTDDIRLVKKAYAEMTRKVHPEENPEEWKKIHSAYHELSTSLRASAARRVNDTGNTEERIIEAQQTGDRTGDEDSEETDGEAVGENNLRQNLGQNEEETVSEEEEIFRIIVDEQQNRDAEKSTDKAESLMTTREKVNLDIITKMYRQQQNHFQSKDSRESIPDRIVSINKPYVRPIVRGKESKNGKRLRVDVADS